jgi:hypothetical protein
MRLTFVAPSATGDALEIASWLRTFSERDHEIRTVVVGEKDRIARALVTLQFIFVDVQTGKPVPTVASFPSSGDRNLTLELPAVGPYLESVKALPRGWKEEAVPPSPQEK